MKVWTGFLRKPRKPCPTPTLVSPVPLAGLCSPGSWCCQHPWPVHGLRAAVGAAGRGDLVAMPTVQMRRQAPKREGEPAAQEAGTALAPSLTAATHSLSCAALPSPTASLHIAQLHPSAPPHADPPPESASASPWQAGTLPPASSLSYPHRTPHPRGPILPASRQCLSPPLRLRAPPSPAPAQPWGSHGPQSQRRHDPGPRAAQPLFPSRVPAQGAKIQRAVSPSSQAAQPPKPLGWAGGPAALHA